MFQLLNIIDACSLRYNISFRIKKDMRKFSCVGIDPPGKFFSQTANSLKEVHVIN